MKEFADKTAPLPDKLAAKYIELRTLGSSPTPDPLHPGKATENSWRSATRFAKDDNLRWWFAKSPRKSASIYFKAGGRVPG